MFEELLDAALYTRRLMLEEERREATAAPPLTPLEVKLIEEARAEAGNGG